MEQNHFSREDRDLLVQLKTEVTGIRIDLREIKDGTSIQITDHETRIRLLETFKSLLMGAFILSNIIIVPVLVWLVINTLNKQ